MAKISLSEATNFTIRTLREVAELARMRARDYLLIHRGSQTLARDMDIEILGPEFARVFVPYFWAIYHHDGRGPIEAKPGKFLVFFPDKRADPRTAGGRRYPRTEADILHLTKQQFYDGISRNRRRLEVGNPQPFMIATRSVGPATGVPFFREGLRNFGEVAGPLIALRFKEFLSTRIQTLSRRSGVTGTLG